MVTIILELGWVEPEPFLPLTAKKILNCFGVTKEFELKDAKAFKVLKPGQKITKPDILFPKSEAK